MEKKIFNISVSADSHVSRIDKFLQSQLNNVSRTKIQNLINRRIFDRIKLSAVSFNWIERSSSEREVGGSNPSRPAILRNED